jgi:hypothetical protein
MEEEQKPGEQDPADE